MTEITMREARWLKKHLDLRLYSTFSNNEPSELCSEYRMETGYMVQGVDAELMRLVTTKDGDNGEFIHKAFLVCKEVEED